MPDHPFSRGILILNSALTPYHATPMATRDAIVSLSVSPWDLLVGFCR